ncbi:MAG: hypothetical protein OIF48_19540 [Silicimonas sp.]|nr:hypothetical protein [Silicimonas sp.]
MMFRPLFVLVAMLAAQSVSAETLRCTQERLSSNGFSSVSVARSWFPKRFALKIEGKTVLSDYYGKGSVSQGKGRKTAVFKSDAGGQKTAVNIVIIEKTGLYTARLRGQAGFIQTSGAKGRCKRIQ